jgi:hypothetical protein
MRLYEFQHGVDLAAQVSTALEFLRGRAHDSKILPPTSTNSLLQLIQNISGQNITFELLQQLKSRNDSIGTLITHLDRENVKLKPYGDEPEVPQEEPEVSGGSAKDPTRTVDQMAKRAANKRS